MIFIHLSFLTSDLISPSSFFSTTVSWWLEFGSRRLEAAMDYSWWEVASVASAITVGGRTLASLRSNSNLNYARSVKDFPYFGGPSKSMHGPECFLVPPLKMVPIYVEHPMVMAVEMASGHVDQQMVMSMETVYSPCLEGLEATGHHHDMMDCFEKVVEKNDVALAAPVEAPESALWMSLSEWEYDHAWGVLSSKRLPWWPWRLNASRVFFLSPFLRCSRHHLVW
ncbi:hypothetical protein AMTR_s00030p00089360 [Amborella trichopoda]|uniref:Uncharacterized protein n=1 Tax=Amborella trichopoda TaxID=13333 RepID=U5CS40_AMBTC|nr:hypothetical protein AMTR_s00030p00089360 [Amborella trichopoda]